MKTKEHLGRDKLKTLSKAEHIKMILAQRKRIDGKQKKINELTEQLAGLSQERDKQKNKEINRHVNEPSSKKPEWDKDGNPKSSCT